MIQLTDEYRKYSNEFKKIFGYGVPLAMIPRKETTENLIENLVKCIEEKKDILPDVYGWRNLEGKIF